MQTVDRDGEIFVAVSLEAVAVKLVAVDLETDDALNHEVNRARVARKEYLLSDGEPAPSQSRASETLGQRMTSGTRCPNCHTHAVRGLCSERVKIDHIDEIHASRPVDSCHCVLMRLGRDDELERLEDPDYPRGHVPVVCLAGPVQNHLGSAWRTGKRHRAAAGASET